MCMGEAPRWVIANDHQHQPPRITAAAYPTNHHSAAQLRGSYGTHGYDCSFSESSLIPRWSVIVAQREGVMVTAPHYHKSTPSLSSIKANIS
jgi:hypothetical protein